MATVPSGILIPWPSTAASIPAGWSRKTALDGYYVQGAGVGADADLTTARGAATHTHTSPTHSPTANSHTHSNVHTLDGPDTTIVVASTTSTNASSDTHSHTTGVTSTGGSNVNDSIAITVNATANDLAYKKVIWIESNGSPTGIPNGAYAFFASDTLPTSWTRVLGNTYLKGADTGGDGGATGGANTHAHTSPAHTHIQARHSHTSTSAIGDFVLKKSAGTTDSGLARATHTHSVDLNPVAIINQPVTTTINSSNHEPVFKKLNVISNGLGVADLPDQIIACWGGTNASIPTDWARFTAMDGNFLKGANADGESNVSTGGSATHTHTASDCQPIQDAHSHTLSDNGASGTALSSGSGATSFAFYLHTHTGWTADSATGTNNPATVTIDANTSESAYPLHRRLIFVRYTTPVAVVARVRTFLRLTPAPRLMHPGIR